jgi:pimeloyl-ACP methyl ester carboxylesterase
MTDARPLSPTTRAMPAAAQRLRVCRSALLAALAWLATGPLAAQTDADEMLRPAATSPLTADVPGVARRFVDVPGARLQWLDFGGRRETVVLLAGLGNTAWIYSGFGPALARQGFRVVALTRRAHGESEAPAAGYDMDALAGDVLALMDSLGVRRAHLVGHSFAGAEMTWLAARHPARVGRIVYLDAAYDRQAHAAFFGREPDTGTPPMTAADHASPEAYLAYQRRARADLAQAWGPPVERDYLASLERQGDGSVRWRHPFARYFEMFRASAAAAPEYAGVQAPSLAVYAQRLRTSSTQQLGADAPPARRDSVAAFEREVIGPWVDASIAQFRAAGRERCVVQMDAIHHLFLQRERETAALVRDFLRGRRVRCA